MNPFTFALYGGSQSPGFLDSIPTARPFFHDAAITGARRSRWSIVWAWTASPEMPDGRFAALRHQYEITLTARHGLTWYQEGVLGPIEVHDFRLRDKTTQETGRTGFGLQEMDTFRARWNQHAVGIVELETTHPDLCARHKGSASFCCRCCCRCTCAISSSRWSKCKPLVRMNRARHLLQSLGFVHSDTGRRFRRERAG